MPHEILVKRGLVDLIMNFMNLRLSFALFGTRWSIESGGQSKGAPELHKMLAEYIWTQSPVPVS